MTPDAAARYIASLELFGMRFGLHRMRALLTTLGDPHREAPAIHIVGSNGKSSTARMAAALLTATGRVVGTYLSPHVIGWHERVLIDGTPVTPEAFAAAVGRVADVVRSHLDDPQDPVTQFEVVTAAAMVACADVGVDALVVEAGLGGRLDATNVFDGQACVALTSIALEHTDVLGDSEYEIAREKLAVVADHADRVVVGPLTQTARAAVRRVCAERDLSARFVGQDVLIDDERPDGSFTVVAPPFRYTGVRLGVQGDFQRSNAATAVGVAQCLVGDLGDAPRALRSVVIPGRLEIIDAQPLIVLDGAHNPHGMRALMDALPSVAKGRPIVAVVSAFRDKDIVGMARAMAPVVTHAVATTSSAPRAADAGLVASALHRAGIESDTVADPIAAVRHARSIAGPAGLVAVCGSLSLVAQVRDTTIAEWSVRPGMLASANRPESAG